MHAAASSSLYQHRLSPALLCFITFTTSEWPTARVALDSYRPSCLSILNVEAGHGYIPARRPTWLPSSYRSSTPACSKSLLGIIVVAIYFWQTRLTEIHVKDNHGYICCLNYHNYQMSYIDRNRCGGWPWPCYYLTITAKCDIYRVILRWSWPWPCLGRHSWPKIFREPNFRRDRFYFRGFI